MNIQAALTAAMRDISAKGIAKLGTANTGAANYRFRGVDQAMNEMSPILVNHGITVTPRYSDLTVAERVKGDPKDGKATRFVTLKGSFTFSAGDGSSVVSECYGEAMDSGDKAVIKAQSVAFRTALFQQFVVPTMAMDTELDGEAEDAPVEALRAAEKGLTAYQAYWTSLTPEAKKALEPHHSELKAIAQEAGKQ